MAFVDMRMPPGWDGMETIERLWQADPRLQIVICTAYSDHAWEEMLERLDPRDRLLVVKKPFDLIEVVQLAHALTAKWSLAREGEERQQQLEATVQQLRASESDLRYTTRELESFAYSLAHDLQSPLERIGAFGALLAEQLVDPDGKATHYVQRMRANAQIGQELVEGLRTLTDIARSPVERVPVDLSRLVLRILDELQASAPERSVHIRVEPGLAACGDRRLLRVALAKLLENAWKFTGRRERAEIEVGMACETPGQRVFFARDNGCGFDMAYADRLFQNFHRLHGPDEYPGTGVGLVIVSRVVVRHGGRIWAESVAGEGSTFYFSLPSDEAVPAGAAPLASAQMNT